MLTIADEHIRASIDRVFETNCVIERHDVVGRRREKVDERDDVIGSGDIIVSEKVIGSDELIESENVFGSEIETEIFYVKRGHWLATFLTYALQRREEALKNLI